MTETPRKSRSRAGRPVNANPGFQRENILRAALAEFSSHGFSGTSVRTIAQQAGVAHGLIRHYFQSKEELFKSAADYLFDQVRRLLLESAARESSTDPVQRLRFQIRSFVHLSAQLPCMAAFLMQAGLNGGEQFVYVVEKFVKPLRELSLVPYRDAVAQGLMIDFDPDFVFLIATHAAMAPFANPAMRQAVMGDSVSDSAQLEQYADTLVDILISGCLVEKAININQ